MSQKSTLILRSSQEIQPKKNHMVHDTREPPLGVGLLVSVTGSIVPVDGQVVVVVVVVGVSGKSVHSGKVNAGTCRHPPRSVLD